MCLEQEQQEHKSRSKNTNPKIKNLKITIFSNTAKSSNPKAPKYQINPKIQHNQSKQKKSQTQKNPSQANLANPPQSWVLVDLILAPKSLFPLLHADSPPSHHQHRCEHTAADLSTLLPLPSSRRRSEHTARPFASQTQSTLHLPFPPKPIPSLCLPSPPKPIPTHQLPKVSPSNRSKHTPTTANLNPAVSSFISPPWFVFLNLLFLFTVSFCWFHRWFYVYWFC